MTRIARGISLHPDTTGETGIIPNIRSPRADIKRPDRGQSLEALFHRNLRGLFRAIRHGFYLDTINNITLENPGWRIAIKKETADESQELLGRFDNEPGQIPTTVHAVYSPNHPSDDSLTYTDPDPEKSREGNAALALTVRAIKPYFTRADALTTPAPTTEQ